MQLTFKSISTDFWTDNRLSLYVFDTNLQTNDPIGYLSFYDHDKLNRRAAVGILVYNKFRRQGYANAILHHLDNLCRDTLHLRQVYVDILDTNIVSQRLFEQAGFLKCGLLRDWVLFKDHYHDVYRYQKLLQ